MKAVIPNKAPTAATAPGSARLVAYAVAAVLHVTALAALAAMPPEQRERFVRAGDGVQIRFYTVSAADAESDLPLNAPLLSDRLAETPQAGAPGDAEGDSASRGSDADGEDDTGSDEAPPSEDDGDTDTPPESAEETAPVEETATVEADAPSEPAASVIATAPRAQTEQPVQEAPRQTARPAPPPPSGPIAADRPVDTIQPDEEEAVRPTLRTPTFADIAARADNRLRPEDFRMGNLDGGVRAVLAEVFCLASGEGMREVGDCGDEPNPAQAELAIYRIRAMSRDLPQFMENMSRAEFELMQMGASPSTLELLRHHFRQAHRETVNTPAIMRAMDRDRASRTDHLGISGPITPQRARDPSGER